ncbi:hypothetical protein EIP86_007206, partial [Pleurotus ostreatoroseus]
MKNEFRAEGLVYRSKRKRPLSLIVEDLMNFDPPSQETSPTSTYTPPETALLTPPAGDLLGPEWDFGNNATTSHGGLINLGTATEAEHEAHESLLFNPPSTAPSLLSALQVPMGLPHTHMAMGGSLDAMVLQLQDGTDAVGSGDRPAGQDDLLTRQVHEVPSDLETTGDLLDLGDQADHIESVVPVETAVQTDLDEEPVQMPQRTFVDASTQTENEEDKDQRPLHHPQSLEDVDAVERHANALIDSQSPVTEEIVPALDETPERTSHQTTEDALPSSQSVGTPAHETSGTEISEPQAAGTQLEVDAEPVPEDAENTFQDIAEPEAEQRTQDESAPSEPRPIANTDISSSADEEIPTLEVFETPEQLSGQEDEHVGSMGAGAELIEDTMHSLDNEEGHTDISQEHHFTPPESASQEEPVAGPTHETTANSNGSSENHVDDPNVEPTPSQPTPPPETEIEGTQAGLDETEGHVETPREHVAEHSDEVETQEPTLESLPLRTSAGTEGTLLDAVTDSASSEQKPDVSNVTAGGDGSLVDTSNVDEHMAEQSVTEQSAAEQSMVEQPTVEQSTVEQSVAERSTAKQPTVEQPTTEQSHGGYDVQERTAEIPDEHIADEANASNPTFDDSTLRFEAPADSQRVVFKVQSSPVDLKSFVLLPSTEESTTAGTGVPAGEPGSGDEEDQERWRESYATALDISDSETHVEVSSLTHPTDHLDGPSGSLEQLPPVTDATPKEDGEEEVLKHTQDQQDSQEHSGGLITPTEGDHESSINDAEQTAEGDQNTLEPNNAPLTSDALPEDPTISSTDPNTRQDADAHRDHETENTPNNETVDQSGAEGLGGEYDMVDETSIASTQQFFREEGQERLDEEVEEAPETTSGEQSPVPDQMDGNTAEDGEWEQVGSPTSRRGAFRTIIDKGKGLLRTALVRSHSASESNSALASPVLDSDPGSPTVGTPTTESEVDDDLADGDEDGDETEGAGGVGDNGTSSPIQPSASKNKNKNKNKPKKKRGKRG